MHLEISTWNKCNNRCLMCTNPPDFGKKKDGLFDFSRIKACVSRAAGQKDVTDVYFTGGEPTIRPDFLEIIKRVSTEFPSARLNVLSNGRRFFYKDFARACVALGNINFIIPIHSHSAKIHDATTRVKGSFEQTAKGVKNILSLRKPGQAVEIRIILTKLNRKNLRKTLDFLFKEFPQIDRIVIIFMEYEGQAIKNLKAVSFKYGEFAPEFKKLAPYFRGKKEIRLYHFPLCLVPPSLWPYVWRTLRADEIIYASKCGRCDVKEFCLGIHKDYLKIFGENEFSPVSGLSGYAIKETDNYHHPIEDVQKRKKN